MQHKFFTQCALLTIILLSALPVLAHDGSEHGGSLEMWVSGIGIIAIISVTVYRLWWQQRGMDYTLEDDPDWLMDDL